MRDVAERAGVSKALVSLVFRGAPGASPENRAKVLEAATAIGYRHNRTASLLARRRNHLLGVSMILRSSFHAELVDEIQAAADERGYELALSPRSRTHDEERSIETLLELRCEGLILLGPEVIDARLDELGSQLPLVAIGRRLKSDRIDLVRTADDKGIEQIVDHLVELGHRRIVHVDGGRNNISADRRRGYRNGMRRNGLSEYAHVISGDFTEESGRLAVAALVEFEELPTAVIAANDRSATGLLDGLNRAGIDVPGQVSVTGYDNSLLSQMAYINLTTVSQTIPQQAEHAVAAIIERLEGTCTVPRDVVLTPKLVVRGTTGRAPSTSTSARR
ncbi:LacI family transcriptional regulator [Glycomyces buryatensis]|uniref:LacI family transcriptional regulator n=2 Tax=Glycomyces buryatensis TaxID=2570927 RepID=A0A4S8PZ30_9ACTN|nr:LacI family transcriptional regulator [Glycomyces buryatensis]